MTGARRPGAGIRRALDEVRFGRDRILDLHAHHPAADEAADRADRWLRQRQVQRAGDVLVITGRGAHSTDGVSVVRQVVLRRLQALKRIGVVAAITEHNAGSFLVTLASVRSLIEAPKRRRGPAPARRADPPSLAELSSDTRESLRALAHRALEALGVQDPTVEYVEDEMLHQFGRLAASTAARGDEAHLRAAIARALEEFEH